MSKADRKAHRALFEDTNKVIRRAEKLIQSLEAMLARRGSHRTSTDLLEMVQRSLKSLRKDAIALDKLGWPKKIKEEKGTITSNSSVKTSRTLPRKGIKATATKSAKKRNGDTTVKKAPTLKGSFPDLATPSPV